MLFLKRFLLSATVFLVKADMKGTDKTPWSRKRKLQAKMERVREAKRSKSLASPSVDGKAVSLVPVTSEGPSESSSRAYGSHQGISMMLDQPLSSDRLD